MPEGPEIHTAANEVARAISGRMATEVFFAFEHLKPYEAELTGRTINAVEARGKAMLIRFAGGLNVYSHNQLYGRWEVTAAGNYPETNRQLRLAIHTEAQSALLYSASDIEVLRDEELVAHPFLSRLGPDLLDESVTVERVVEQLSRPEFRRRQLAALLLDQGFLAGPGNYLRSEILFDARLHPTQRPVDLSEEQLQRLAAAALRLARQSYQTGGVTNDPERAERLRREGAAWGEVRFQVFNREGQPCFVCGSAIVKETFGSRRLYLCRECQPL